MSINLTLAGFDDFKPFFFVQNTVDGHEIVFLRRGRIQKRVLVVHIAVVGNGFPATYAHVRSVGQESIGVAETVVISGLNEQSRVLNDVSLFYSEKFPGNAHFRRISD